MKWNGMKSAYPLTGGQGVAGSNPVIPTNFPEQFSRFLPQRSLFVRTG